MKQETYSCFLSCNANLNYAERVITFYKARCIALPIDRRSLFFLESMVKRSFLPLDFSYVSFRRLRLICNSGKWCAVTQHTATQSNFIPSACCWWKINIFTKPSLSPFRLRHLIRVFFRNSSSNKYIDEFVE